MFRRIAFFVMEKKTDIYIYTKSDDKESILLFLLQNQYPSIPNGRVAGERGKKRVEVSEES